MNHETRIQQVMERFNCNRQDAERVIDLRDEGYSICQATLMTGVTDPDYWISQASKSRLVHSAQTPPHLTRA